MIIKKAKSPLKFQSTPSVGRATANAGTHEKTNIFQSTPSVGRATIVQGYRFPNIIISIHALRGEGDNMTAYGGS